MSWRAILSNGGDKRPTEAFYVHARRALRDVLLGSGDVLKEHQEFRGKR